jgi:molecular chaperone DnaK
MNELIVGIDLGTTNSELAAVLDGEVKVIPIHGNPIMPSCVGIDSAGKLIVGQAAKNQLVAAPESTILSIKRKMGGDTKVSLGGKEFSPEEISSFILRELKQEGERELGRSIHKAVITVPAFFNEQQRKATQVAGELAGLEVVRILNEPTAAALAYGGGGKEGETMLVYDLGGGTFDVSVVTVEAGVVEVKASHGDTHLGGDDFDQLLVDYAVNAFRLLHGQDLHQDLKTLRRLKVAMERAKCRLSDEPLVNVREEFLDGQHHLELEILRDRYEEMILPWMQKTLTCLHQSLNDAKLGPKDISKVMLVGGATRTPLVHHLLRHKLDLEPRFEINPDLIVAMGAAVQGGVLAGEKLRSILVDITPHTFSTGAIMRDFNESRLMCFPIIPRNTPLPASKAEMFATCYDNETEIKVTAYQGESPEPVENSLIGDFLVEGLSKVPAGNQVIIHFDLDLSGMLKVTATEKATGLVKTVTMDTRGARTLDLDQARRNIASLVGEPEAALDVAELDSPDHASQLATAKDLRKRAEALLQKNISPDDAEELRHLLRGSAEAISTNADLTNLNEALADLLFYLED